MYNVIIVVLVLTVTFGPNEHNSASIGHTLVSQPYHQSQQPIIHSVAHIQCRSMYKAGKIHLKQKCDGYSKDVRMGS